MNVLQRMPLRTRVLLGFIIVLLIPAVLNVAYNFAVVVPETQASVGETELTSLELQAIEIESALEGYVDNLLLLSDNLAIERYVNSLDDGIDTITRRELIFTC